MRVLLIEDDPLIASGVLGGLRAHELDAQHAADGASAQALQAEARFDAVVLDLGLPDIDGMQLLTLLRTVDPDLPVLILTARDGIEHRLSSLDGGADDYMTKPFDLRELVARLHALVRRSQGRSDTLIQAGPLRLDTVSGLAWFEDQPVDLSRREMDLLTQLASSNGRWLSAETLRERLGGHAESAGSNVLNVHIHNIRRKLGANAIETARGLGYRLGWKPA